MVTRDPGHLLAHLLRLLIHHLLTHIGRVLLNIQRAWFISVINLWLAYLAFAFITILFCMITVGFVFEATLPFVNNLYILLTNFLIMCVTFPFISRLKSCLANSLILLLAVL